MDLPLESIRYNSWINQAVTNCTQAESSLGDPGDAQLRQVWNAKAQNSCALEPLLKQDVGLMSINWF